MSSADTFSQALFLGNRLLLEGAQRGTVKYFLPTNNLLDHVFLCGDISSEKTLFAKAILEEISIKGIPSIIIDFTPNKAYKWLHPEKSISATI